MGPSVGNDGVMSYWLHFTMPEQASKTWENLRENLVRIEGDDVKIDATGWETLDPGNYSRGTGRTRPASAPAPGAVRRARTESVCRLGGRHDPPHPPDGGQDQQAHNATGHRRSGGIGVTSSCRPAGTGDPDSAIPGRGQRLVTGCLC